MPTTIISGFLYLGSYDTASRQELLKSLGISHILNTVPNCPALYKNTFSYHTVEHAPPEFEECFKFLGDTKRLQDLEVQLYGTCSAPSGFAFISLPALTPTATQQQQPQQPADAGACGQQPLWGAQPDAAAFSFNPGITAAPFAATPSASFVFGAPNAMES
eukprot:gene12671-12798_t